MDEGPILCTASLMLINSSFFEYSYSDACEVVPHCRFNLHLEYIILYALEKNLSSAVRHSVPQLVFRSNFLVVLFKFSVSLLSF